MSERGNHQEPPPRPPCSIGSWTVRLLSECRAPNADCLFSTQPVLLVAHPRKGTGVQQHGEILMKKMNLIFVFALTAVLVPFALAQDTNSQNSSTAATTQNTNSSSAA